MRQLLACPLGVLILALLTSCDHDVYDVFMQPLDTGFRRGVECRRIDLDEQQREVLKPMPQEVLDHLAGLYEQPPPLSAARKFPFLREFAGSTPPDVGGAGYCRRWRSSLGSLGVYVERFRGSDDQAGLLENRQQAADRLRELLSGWLEARLGKTAEWGQLSPFLTGPLRQDLRNLVLLVWAGDFAQGAGYASAAGKTSGATLVRGLLFLAERGYLQAQDVPLWARAVADQGRSDRSLAPLAPLIAAAVARRAGLAPDSGAIGALRRELEQPEMIAGLEAWLRTTPEWQAASAAQTGAVTSAPVEILGQLALRAAGLDSDPTSSDELRLRLALPTEPFQANATWDAAKGEASWETILPGPGGTPFLAYASWAEPDEEAQALRFGKAILRGEALGQYVLWVHGLSREDQAEWGAFLDRLRPAGEPAARVAEFRFDREMAAGPPTEESLQASLAQPAREVLLKALQDGGQVPVVLP